MLSYRVLTDRFAGRCLSFRKTWLLAACAFVTLSGCPSAPSTFIMESSVFSNGGPIPVQYAGQDATTDVSPPLFWTEPPAGTQEFALIVTNEVGQSRWILYKIPATIRELPQGIPPGAAVLGFPPGAMQGLNFDASIGYEGPAGDPLRVTIYQFTLYALDTVLELPPGLLEAELLAAMEGHVIGLTTLIGTFDQRHPT